MTGAGITVLIMAWLIWVALVLSYGLDFIIAWYGKSKALQTNPASPSPPTEFIAALAGMSLAQAGLIFLVRWFFLRHLIQPRRLQPGTWPASLVALLGVIMIYALIKAIEVYGLVLWFGSQTWSHYLPFAIVSFLILLAYMPCFLLTRPVIQRSLPLNPA